MSDQPEAADRGSVMGQRLAASLAFGSSASVLVVELVALRLLAPYYGLTLETSTLVIGIALTAIAAGSWAGGRAADVVAPAALLGPLLGISGAVVAATPFVVRGAGEIGDGTLLLLAAAGTILAPGALLSAVTPVVIKLRLTSLAETGTVVGRLSGIATVGSIAGTVVTGFVLISRFAVSSILVGLGVLLVLVAAGVEWHVRGRRRALRTVAAPALVVGLGGLAAALAPGGCDVETTYHCVVVEADPDRGSGRTLVLDGLGHSYTDLDDPTHLEFAYVRAIASVLDVAFPAGEPIGATHLGAGALTVPTYVAETRPGSRNVVSEIDPGVLEVDREVLGTGERAGIETRVEDARLGVRRLDDDSRDVVVGDAFGGVSVPWHLATREAVADIRRVLGSDGVYVANLIDRGPLDFARAEVATYEAVFDEVVLLAEASTLDGPDGVGDGLDGGNLVAVASDRSIDVEALGRRLAEREPDWVVVEGPRLARFVGEASVLTDDRAPVDQLLTAY